MPFSLQDAYDSAVDGAVVTIPAGPLALDDVGRQAATIFGDLGPGAKRVTFVGSPSVIHTCRVLTIGADNVTLKGTGWWVHYVMVGEGGDTSRGPIGVTIEDVHMDAIEVVGSQATLRRCEIGPCLLGYSSSSSRPAAQKLDPNSSDPMFGPTERFYAVNGGSQDVPDPFFHNNSGGFHSRVLMEDCLIHGYQTLDADSLHTGGGILWNGPGDPLDWTVIRRCTYEKLAVQGLQTTETDGVTVEDCIFRGAYEPFSNVGRYVWVLADSAQKDLIVHKSGGTLRRFRIRGNRFCNGIRPQDFSITEDVRIENNDLGTASAPFPGPGVTYVNNTAQGTGCSNVAPPPPDTIPPSTPSVSLGTITQTSVGISWAASSDASGVADYGVYRNGVRIAEVPTLAYSFVSLSCGTSYQLGVDAYDAAGNRSAVAMVAAVTVACSPPPPPSYNMNAEYDRLEATTTYARWAKANPNEATRVEAYWRSGGTKPTVVTAFGVFLANAAEEIRR